MLHAMHIQQHGIGTKAFTVLEMLVALAIAAILAVAGLPALQDFSRRQHMKAAVTALHSDLFAARSAAIQSNRNVIACPGEPASGCNGTSDWSAGWIVFGDDNRDRAKQATELLLRQGQGHTPIRIQGSAGRHNLRFLPNGSTPGSNSSITFCGPGGPKHARKLVISNLGRIRRNRVPGLDPGFCPD